MGLAKSIPAAITKLWGICSVQSGILQIPGLNGVMSETASGESHAVDNCFC